MARLTDFHRQHAPSKEDDETLEGGDACSTLAQDNTVTSDQ
jgi:hypothetical protein